VRPQEIQAIGQKYVWFIVAHAYGLFERVDNAKVAKNAPYVFSFPEKCEINALHGKKRSKRILIAGYLATFPRNVCISNEKARFSIRIEENLPRKSSFTHYLLQEHTFHA